MNSYAQQMMQLYSARTDEDLNKIFFQIVSQPTPSSSRLMNTLKCNLNTHFRCEFNKLNGNILVHFPRKCRVDTISIMNSRFNGYELALIDSNSLRYIHSIGYSDVRMFDTDNEVIEEIKRIYTELCKMQQVHNKKQHFRKKSHKNRNSAK